MSKKILVADDSPTIQKVITITFASDPYKLTVAENADSMFELLKRDKFDLVLLDFSLSDSKTGYELSKEIREQDSTVPILAMLGTFDSVDEALFSEARINDRIVKPFESQLFIQKCRTMLESSPEELADWDSESTAEYQVEELAGDEDQAPAEDDWTIESQNVLEMARKPNFDQPAETTNNSDPSFDTLKNEMSEWGVEVPATIQGESELEMSFPPVIDDEQQEESSSELEFNHTDELSLEVEDEQSLPDSSDLEFPTELTLENVSEPEPTPELSSQLVPLDELEPVEDEEEDLVSDDTNPVNVLENIQQEENEQKMLDAIEEDVNPDDFWAVDETTGPTAENLEGEVAGSIENPDISQEVADLKPTLEPETPAAVQAVAIDEDAIVEKLMAKLTPVIEQKVEKLCEQISERVSWEVIPDLAENLIRDELKAISKEVEADH